jgi:hypothetical protein
MKPVVEFRERRPPGMTPRGLIQFSKTAVMAGRASRPAYASRFGIFSFENSDTKSQVALAVPSRCQR